MVLYFRYGGIMKNKIIFTLLLSTLVLTGCKTDLSSEPISSEEPSTSDTSNTSEVNPNQPFIDQEYREIKGFPLTTLRSLFTRQDVNVDWVNDNILGDSTGTNDTLYYTKNFQQDEGVTTYLFHEILIPGEIGVYETYLNALNTEVWTITTIEDQNTFSAEALDGVVQIIGAYILENTEEEPPIPSYTYLRFRVKEKEEFPNALKPSKDAKRVEIAFNNTFKITELAYEKVVWDFLGLEFSVEKYESEYNVGNLPNGIGGYLSNPNLRVYEGQLLSFTMTDKRLEQVIVHTVDYTDGGTEVVSLDALPTYDDASVKSFVNAPNILYHLHEEVSTFSFKVTANARLVDVIAIYS